MTNYDYSRVNWDAVERLSRWYSGDIQDVMDRHGFYGFLKSLSLQTTLKPGEVICGPVHTVLYEKSTRTGQPQDVYHNAIDNVAKGAVLVVDSSCAEGSGTGELMSTGAKTAGAVATIVNGTVRDIAEVQKLDYPLFARGVSPVGVSGRMEPAKSQVELVIDGVSIRPGDIIFADICGVVVIPEELVAIVAADADANGNAESECRERILSGEKLQSIWPLGSSGPA